MAIIDMDSHLRDGWLFDEIYRLPEPFANYSPKRIGAGNYFYSKFEHGLSPMEDPVANANFKKPVTPVWANFIHLQDSQIRIFLVPSRQDAKF